MTTKLEQIVARRQALIDRIASQRADLGEKFNSLDRQLEWPERIFRVASAIQKAPWLVGAGLTAWSLYQSRFFPQTPSASKGGWFVRSMSVFQGFRTALNWWTGFQSKK